MMMFRRISCLKWMTIVGVTLFAASLADAKPPKSPTTPPTPAGLVYYHDGMGVMQMKADGTEKTFLFPVKTGEIAPSSKMYGGKRWWLVNLYPDDDGPANLFATNGLSWIQITDSGIVDNGDGTETLAFFWGTPSWSNDGQDSFCSIHARRGTRLLGSSDSSKIEAVIYRFKISASDLEAMSLIGYEPLIFDGDPLATPVINTAATLMGDALGPHHWSPDGNQIAFTNKNPGDVGPVLRVADVSDGPVPASTGLVLFNNNTSNGVLSVQWSPNGQRIAFSTTAQVYTINPTGSNLVNLTSGFQPYWSPDSLRLTYRIRTTNNRSNLYNTSFYDIATIPAGGGSIVNLTTDGFLKFGLGWRN
jgi:hypothetical protein